MKCLKQMSEFSKNWKSSSIILVEKELIIFEELINEELFCICVVC